MHLTTEACSALCCIFATKLLFHVVAIINISSIAVIHGEVPSSKGLKALTGVKKLTSNYD